MDSEQKAYIYTSTPLRQRNHTSFDPMTCVDRRTDITAQHTSKISKDKITSEYTKSTYREFSHPLDHQNPWPSRPHLPHTGCSCQFGTIYIVCCKEYIKFSFKSMKTCPQTIASLHSSVYLSLKSLDWKGKERQKESEVLIASQKFLVRYMLVVTVI